MNPQYESMERREREKKMALDVLRGNIDSFIANNRYLEKKLINIKKAMDDDKKLHDRFEDIMSDIRYIERFGLRGTLHAIGLYLEGKYRELDSK